MVLYLFIMIFLCLLREPHINVALIVVYGLGCTLSASIIKHLAEVGYSSVTDRHRLELPSCFLVPV